MAPHPAQVEPFDGSGVALALGDGADQELIQRVLSVVEMASGDPVLALDVGRRGSTPVLPAASLNGLKRELPDPVSWFLGQDFEAALLPGVTEEYYGIPPSKNFVFDQRRSMSAGSSRSTSIAARQVAATEGG